MEFKILLVDDEKEITGALSQILLGQGYRVVQAGSGDEAAAIIQEDAVDLVILDLNMPGLSGIEVLKRLKVKAPRTRVVVLTGFPELEPEVRKIGCDGFITKPLAVSELVERINALLTHKDEDELKEYTMGAKVWQAYPGEPLATLLLFEPIQSIAQLLLRFLDNSQEAKGVYKVEWATSLEKATDFLFAVHPDILLMDLMTVQDPAEAVKKLLSCPVQPKDYIFYMHSKVHKPLPSPLPGKRWDGNPWKQEDLNVLAQLIRKTALDHGLIKR